MTIEEYQQFKLDFPDIFLDLILLTMADTLGSQLEENKPAKFKFKIDFYKKVLEEY